MRQPDSLNPVIQSIVTATMAAFVFGVASAAIKNWKAGKRGVAVAWALGAPAIAVLALIALAPVFG